MTSLDPSNNQRQTQIQDNNIERLEIEVKRYKSTLSKMESQWREAIETSKQQELKIQNKNKQIQNMTEQVNKLKTEIQILKVKG